MSQLDAETPPHRLSADTAVKTMAGGFAAIRPHGGQVMIPGVGPVVAFYKSLPQHPQIGAALGAIHAKDCRWCDIGNGRRASIRWNESVVY